VIEALESIEWDASRRSIIHDLDGRVKIILSFLMIILVVGYPASAGIFILAIIYAAVIALCWLLSRLPVLTYLKRLAMTLPFGFSIIFFQIFFKNPRADTITLVSLPFPFFPVYAESVWLSSILLVKFLLCISVIIVLSSTTPVNELLTSGKRLGLPPVMGLALGMMIRYLFLFGRNYTQIQHALCGKNFDPFDRRLPHMYRLKTLGFAMGSLFLRAYEQGERTFSAMQARGYGTHMLMHLQKKPLTPIELCILIISVPLLVLLEVMVFLRWG